LIIYITTGNQTQSKVYVDQFSYTIEESIRPKESKNIQVDTFVVKNIKHSQLQTVAVMTRDAQVQSAGGQYVIESDKCCDDSECGISGMSTERVYENEFKQQFGISFHLNA
jgi:hypothetical protein